MKRSKGKGPGRKKMFCGRNYEEGYRPDRSDKKDRGKKGRSREMGVDNGVREGSGQGGNLKKERKEGVEVRGGGWR